MRANVLGLGSQTSRKVADISKGRRLAEVHEKKTGRPGGERGYYHMGNRTENDKNYAQEGTHTPRGGHIDSLFTVSIYTDPRYTVPRGGLSWLGLGLCEPIYILSI